MGVILESVQTFFYMALNVVVKKIHSATIPTPHFCRFVLGWKFHHLTGSHEARKYVVRIGLSNPSLAKL